MVRQRQQGESINSQLSALNYRLCGYSVTSLSCVPSTSIFPPLESRPSVRQLPDEASIISRLELFVYDLDLLVEHFPGEAVDRDMHPVMLLTFDDKVVRQTLRVRFILS